MDLESLPTSTPEYPPATTKQTKSQEQQTNGEPSSLARWINSPPIEDYHQTAHMQYQYTSKSSQEDRKLFPIWSNHYPQGTFKGPHRRVINNSLFFGLKMDVRQVPINRSGRKVAAFTGKLFDRALIGSRVLPMCADQLVKNPAQVSVKKIHAFSY